MGTPLAFLYHLFPKNGRIGRNMTVFFRNRIAAVGIKTEDLLRTTHLTLER